MAQGHHKVHQSTVYLHRVQPSQSDNCELTVTVLAATISAGHKFKITGVMANEFTGQDYRSVLGV